MMRIWLRLCPLVIGLTGWFSSVPAFSAGPNSLMMNEVNMVSGNNFLEKNKVDTALGRVQGNGQNWWEFLVVAGDTGKKLWTVSDAAYRTL